MPDAYYPMPTITTTSETSTTVPKHRVYLRQLWGEPWEEEPYLWCDTCALRASPEQSSAVLHYDYGTIIQPDEFEPAYYPPLEIEHWYVKIEIDWVNAAGDPAPIVWYGIVYDRDDDAFGSVNPSSGQGSGTGSGFQKTGRQKFTCHGMEVLLARETIRSSWVQNSLNQAGLPTAPEVELGRPLNFNAELGIETAAADNRSPDKGNRGAFLFSDSNLTGQPWSTFDVVNYLLAYQTPANADGNVAVPFELGDEDPVPTFDRPRLEIKTDTVKELLDKLLSRKRMLSYFVTVDEDGPGGTVQIWPFTFLTANLGVPFSYPNANGSFTSGTATLAANPVQVALDFSQAFDIEFASLKRTAQDRYDQVIVRGARKMSCFTVSYLDGTLRPDWDVVGLEEEYTTAASTQPDYPPTSALRQWRNQLWRSADKYKRVFRHFAVPLEWDGYCDNGDASGTVFPAFPTDDDEDICAPFCRRALRFHRKLPLYTDRDYSANNIAAGTVTGLGIGSGSGSGAAPELLDPLAFLKILSPSGEGWGNGSGSGSGSGPAYQHVEKLSECTKTDKHSLGGPSFTCSLRMQDRCLGIELHVHGAPQHAIAGEVFSPIDFSDFTPLIKFTDNLLCTLACEEDAFVEANWPLATPDKEEEPDAPEEDADAAEEEPQIADVNRVLLIDLSHLEHGNALRLDYVVPGTVVAIKDGQLVRSDGGYVRDDRGRLNAIAQVAWQWYQKERAAFVLKYRQIDGQFSLGDLVTYVGPSGAAEAVNTPITSIEWDLLNGTTTITTGFAELDFNGFF